MATVVNITIYPIKSFRGISVPAAALQETGLAHDRQWMLVDEGGKFVTQRSHPAMAYIEPWLEAGMLHLRAPGMREGISLPVDDFDAAAAPRLDSHVFRSPVQTRVEGQLVNQWLSDYLKQPVRLVRFDGDSRRVCRPVEGMPVGGGSAGGSTEMGGPEVITRLADAYPLLIASTASLRELNRRLVARGAEPVEMLRFRPNIVIDDDEIGPHDEDDMAALVHADYTLQMLAPCARCSMPNLDHATGQFGEEPTRTLREYRLNRQGTSVLFGVHAHVAQGAGTATIRVGDVLEPE